MLQKKSANPRLLGARRKQREARAKGFERAIQRWMAIYANFKLRQARASLLGKFAKADQEQWFTDKLVQAISLYGVRELGDAVNSAAGAVLIDGKAVTDAAQNKGTNIKWLWEYRNGIIQRAHGIMQDTNLRINQQVNEIITEALGEDPVPSVGDVARRIRSEAFENRFVFSPARAATIARTELSQAQNTGAFNGYEATGVARVEWLAFKDGKSGGRHHERMDGKQVNIGEKFRMPSGELLRFPGDPLGSIQETINCRCSIAPVI